MSYPSNRHPRDREHAPYEDDERGRGLEGRQRTYRSARERPGERDTGAPERFGERRYLDPYSGRSLGGHEEYGHERERERRQGGYAPYPYGEERQHRELEDWQRPWQLGEERGRGDERPYGPGYESAQGRYASRGYESREYGSRGRQEGPYRGRGPKGYQRSDERLREEICERLTDDAQIDASEINVEVASGEVTLTGSVPDRRMKRSAEDLIEEISGVKQVHNHLRVEGERGHMGERDDRYTGTRH